MAKTQGGKTKIPGNLKPILDFPERINEAGRQGACFTTKDTNGHEKISWEVRRILTYKATFHEIFSYYYHPKSSFLEKISPTDLTDLTDLLDPFDPSDQSDQSEKWLKNGLLNPSLCGIFIGKQHFS